MDDRELLDRLETKPRVVAGRWPTPLEPLGRLGPELGCSLWAKRDDLSGFALGGNKIRQLEYYLGEALAQQADTVLITGAVQSNFVRSATAFAARFGFECHVQLEERVTGVSDLYRQTGNALLDRLFGAHIHTFAVGEDEHAADDALELRAAQLRRNGKKTYVIHLSADKPPLGALGYVRAAIELAGQLTGQEALDAIYVGSGSASTHCGLLFGLRALGLQIPVHGICVRRNATLQAERVRRRCQDLATLLEMPLPFDLTDVLTDDCAFGPGYGKLTPMVAQAIKRTARSEGMLIDPVYTGRVMAALMTREEDLGRNILFWHTGGEPGVFAYADQF